MVTIREDGRERRVTAAEAFLLQLLQKGLAGDGAAARSSLEAIEAARNARRARGQDELTIVTISFVGMGIEVILAKLGLALKKFPYDEQRVRWDLQPWIVQAALARMGQKQLTIEEQREVWANTRIPNKVAWPDWWTVRA